MRTVSAASLKPKGQSGVELKKPRPEPKVVPIAPHIEVAAPEVNVTPEVNIDLSPAVQNNAEVLSVVKEALEAQKPAENPTEWEFKFNRDDRGFVQTITAKAK
jgi:hypothetical protein